MIKLVPVEQTEAIQAMCEQYHIDYSAQIHAYRSATQGLKAECLFALDNYHVSLLAIAFDGDDPLIPELLIRAVGAYAANRSGYLFTIDKAVGQAIEPTLKTMRFDENESAYFGTVPKILEGHCKHKNNQ